MPDLDLTFARRRPPPNPSRSVLTGAYMVLALAWIARVVIQLASGGAAIWWPILGVGWIVMYFVFREQRAWWRKVDKVGERIGLTPHPVRGVEWAMLALNILAFLGDLWIL